MSLRLVVKTQFRCAAMTALFCLALIESSRAQEDPAALASELSNPIASLISVPFQWNYNDKIGPEKDAVTQTASDFEMAIE